MIMSTYPRKDTENDWFLPNVKWCLLLELWTTSNHVQKLVWRMSTKRTCTHAYMLLTYKWTYTYTLFCRHSWHSHVYLCARVQNIRSTGRWYTHPSEKWSSSVGIIIPNIWKNNPNVPNHQPVTVIQVRFTFTLVKVLSLGFFLIHVVDSLANLCSIVPFTSSGSLTIDELRFLPVSHNGWHQHYGLPSGYLT